MAKSIEKLPHFLEDFARLNPGSIAFAEKDVGSCFHRAIVIVGAFVDARLGLQPVMGINCSHTKCPWYSGVQIHLVGRNGNLRNITITFALVLLKTQITTYDF